MKKSYTKLRKNFNVFLELHEHYGYYRIPMKDSEVETEAVTNEGNYVGEANEHVTTTTRLLNKYKRVLNDCSMAISKERHKL